MCSGDCRGKRSRGWESLTLFGAGGVERQLEEPCGFGCGPGEEESSGNWHGNRCEEAQRIFRRVWGSFFASRISCLLTFFIQTSLSHCFLLHCLLFWVLIAFVGLHGIDKMCQQ